MIIRNKINAVSMKFITAMMNAPQSIYTDLVMSIAADPNDTCTPLASLGTSIVISPLRSPMGIVLMSGLNMLLTSALTIAVNAAPIIMPTARSITFPRVMNFLNSPKNFFIILSFYVFILHDFLRCVFSSRAVIFLSYPILR